MAKVTRRGLFGLAGGAAALTGCQSLGEPAFQPPFAGNVAFEHGVASGDPQSDRVILWTRVTPSINAPVWVVWQVFADQALSNQVAAGGVQTSAARDYTVKVDASGLVPGQTYYYIFTVNTEAGPVPSALGRTKTLAASGTEPVRAAVVSCSNYPFGFFHAYDAISQIDDLDVVIHLGDYLYEYGREGYGGEVGAQIGREHEPATEITKLADYRARHAQYKSDKALQRAHAAAPWICTWDDHESANNAYRTGAQNHNEGEGAWSDRKQIAVQAYLEWMPVRDPQAGTARQALWRHFEFGDLASLICLETRLTGRSEEISWSAELSGVKGDDTQAKVRDVITRVNDPARTMLGAKQEGWLGDRLAGSVRAGKSWQVLANQIIMARVKTPNFNQTLSASDKANITEPRVRGLLGFSELGQPLNLDAWDGFPAARERLYADAKEAGANLVTLTGDTHTGWANQLRDKDGGERGVEFGCTSVTSPGFGRFMPGVSGLGDMFVEANEDVTWHDPEGGGYTILEMNASSVTAHFYKVGDVTKQGYIAKRIAGFRVTASDPGTLKPV